MKITYIAHSGFFVQTEEVYLLFDYYRGEIPELPAGSRLFVFVSHRHEDHFNPEIMKLSTRYQVTYILSYDIRLNAYGMRKYDITEDMKKNIVSMRYGEEYGIDEIKIWTYKSTDEGVAFLVQAGEKFLYHAGDHNWWHWSGESKQYNNNMAAIYKRGIEMLNRTMQQQNAKLDVAFLPLDPRLEDSYYYGMKYFLENVKCKDVFPMHFSTNSLCQKQFVEEYGYADKVHILEREGCSVYL